MSLTELEVSGYRSLKAIRLSLGRLNVVTGPNGSGKSNLYRALWLIAQICEGEFSRAIAQEGGFLSAMWAGPRANKKTPVRMSLGFYEEHFSYQLTCGFPPPSDSRFLFDPGIKEEYVWFGGKRKPSTTLLERKGESTWIRDVDGARVEYPLMLYENESVLSQLREPHRFPELFRIRDLVRGWRFYHSFRTDENSPIRSPRVSFRTHVLSDDGRDLAGALQTILEMGDAGKLMETIESALPGRELRIIANDPEFWNKSPRCTEWSVGLETAGCARTLLARELSDGTLKFLCLAAALLSPHPAELIALNEPEASLHPDLIDPLGKLIVDASSRSQVWISTHSQPLANVIRENSGVRPIELELVEGMTKVITRE